VICSIGVSDRVIGDIERYRTVSNGIEQSSNDIADSAIRYPDTPMTR
jgi:hypothetical protein